MKKMATSFLVFIDNILRSKFERTDTHFKSELKIIRNFFTQSYTKTRHGTAMTV